MAYRPPKPLHSIILLGTLVGLIVWIENVENQNLFWGPLHDSAHAFAFFLLTLLLLSLLSNEKRQSGLVLAQLGGSLFFAGIILELGQPAFGRSSSFTDIYYNFIGIGTAMTITASKPLSKGKRTIVIAAASLLLLSSLTIPVLGALTIQQRNAMSPVLLDFEDNWQRHIYKAGGSAHLGLVASVSDWDNVSTALKVDFPQTRYPGFSIKHVYPDWSGFEALSFEVFSKNNEPKTLTIRVHDTAHDQRYEDRFNQRLSIQPGLNRFTISLKDIEKSPDERALKLDDIAGIAFFSGSPAETFSLYFDNIQLLTKL